ncbi:MAG: ADP-ribosylglycohydrolase family protein, partial [Planctomycetota bacterium]
MTDTADRFAGSLLGLALADAMGAKYEGGLLGALIWKTVGGESGGMLRWTDDTQMALGLAESLVENRGFDADHLAARWAERMEGWRGYGPGARKLLGLIKAGADWREANRSVFPDGSYGNGAAMRAAPLGLFFGRDTEELRRATETASAITHAHPLGIEGGLLIARAAALALEDPFDPAAFLSDLRAFCRQAEYRKRLDQALAWLGEDPSKTEVRKRLGNSVLAHESAVTAVHAFCRFRGDFTRMVEFIIGLGGDTDTIGAMAGGI